MATGDATHPFSIQSVSKPFVFALVCDAIGHDEARQKLGVNSTGLPFNSVMADRAEHRADDEPDGQRRGDRDHQPRARRDRRRQVASRPRRAVALRRADLEIDEEVYESESATNLRNQGIAHLLDSYEPAVLRSRRGHRRLHPAVLVDGQREDLAVMGATLADGGVNPLTGGVSSPPTRAHAVLAVLATAGLYERSGEWLYEVGLPGKSGVSGGIVDGRSGQGRPRDVLAAARRGRQQRPRAAPHDAPLRALGLNLFASTGGQRDVATSSHGTRRSCRGVHADRYEQAAVAQSQPPERGSGDRGDRHRADHGTDGGRARSAVECRVLPVGGPRGHDCQEPNAKAAAATARGGDRRAGEPEHMPPNADSSRSTVPTGPPRTL